MIEGGCRCGAVRYSLAVADLPPAYCCHCLDCQASSGSAFSEQAVAAAPVAAEGPIIDYRFTRPDGSDSHHRLCGQCFTRLWSTNSTYPEITLLRAGTLDRSQDLRPAAHIWVKRKQDWVVLPPDVPQWPENAPAAEFARALGPR